MKIHPTVNIDSIKCTLKAVFIQSMSLPDTGGQTMKREMAYSNLPMFCLSVKSLKPRMKPTDKNVCISEVPLLN